MFVAKTRCFQSVSRNVRFLTRILAALSLSAVALGADSMPPVGGATAWLNVPTQSAPDLRGKVMVVQFWTYTCVNWRRTLPYMRAWSAKYRDQNLVVVGVHTPEFDFEGNADNVRTALKEMHIDYPIAVDSQHAIWDAFHNVYWPALYLIDSRGKIRYRHFGEGEYAHTEREIQKLLSESGTHPASDLAVVTPVGAEIPADLATLKSPETYVGLEMGERFASRGGTVPDGLHEYLIPKHLALNEWALSGSWSFGRQAASLAKSEGKIVYRFHARDLNLIMAPPKGGSQVRFHVLIDGQPPGAAHGEDIDEQGYGSVIGLRMYQLIRQPGPIVDREATIEFLEPGVAVYDFTFG
jgi:thiol-disulfide isomerase/thioredoxin